MGKRKLLLFALGATVIVGLAFCTQRINWDNEFQVEILEEEYTRITPALEMYPGEYNATFCGQSLQYDKKVIVGNVDAVERLAYVGSLYPTNGICQSFKDEYGKSGRILVEAEGYEDSQDVIVNGFIIDPLFNGIFSPSIDGGQFIGDYNSTLIRKSDLRIDNRDQEISLCGKTHTISETYFIEGINVLNRIAEIAVTMPKNEEIVVPHKMQKDICTELNIASRIETKARAGYLPWLYQIDLNNRILTIDTHSNKVFDYGYESFVEIGTFDITK